MKSEKKLRTDVLEALLDSELDRSKLIDVTEYQDKIDSLAPRRQVDDSHEREG